MKTPRRFFDFLFLATILLLSKSAIAQQTTNSTAGKNGFRAAIVKVDITPEDSQNLLGYGARKSTGVHDRIYHRIVVLDDGISQIYIVSSDICEVSPSEYDLVAGKAKQELGINPMNLWWAVTHTHSAPEVGPPGLGSTFLGDRFKHEVDANYTSMVERKLIDGIKEAKQKLARSGLGVRAGKYQPACPRC